MYCVQLRSIYHGFAPLLYQSMFLLTAMIALYKFFVKFLSILWYLSFHLPVFPLIVEEGIYQVDHVLQGAGRTEPLNNYSTHHNITNDDTSSLVLLNPIFICQVCSVLKGEFFLPQHAETPIR